MKVHPILNPTNNNAISIRYQSLTTTNNSNNCLRVKKLCRLPHIFEKVLELPFNSDADVSIQETADWLRFTVITDGISGDVRADAIEMYTGVTKIVVSGDGVFRSIGSDFEIDLWRFRLPACTLPEMATAVYFAGQLVVTVPKGRPFTV